MWSNHYKSVGGFGHIYQQKLINGKPHFCVVSPSVQILCVYKVIEILEVNSQIGFYLLNWWCRAEIDCYKKEAPCFYAVFPLFI